MEGVGIDITTVHPSKKTDTPDNAGEPRFSPVAVMMIFAMYALGSALLVRRLLLQDETRRIVGILIVLGTYGTFRSVLCTGLLIYDIFVTAFGDGNTVRRNPLYSRDRALILGCLCLEYMAHTCTIYLG